MWDRKVLKARGKSAFMANYWKCVLVALVLALIAGGGGSFSSGYSGGQRLGEIRNQYNDDYMEDFIEDRLEAGDDISDLMPYIDEFGEYGDIDDLPFDSGIGSIPGSGSGLFTGAMLAIILVVIFVAIVLGILIDIFLIGPLEVGCRRFFLLNCDGKPEAGEMGFAFKNNYMNVVKVLFFRNIHIFLWTLLLIIPGIIKAYEYFMVSYILAENPAMDRKEALQLSKDMMYGNKMDTFILRLSFIGWDLLSALLLGFPGIFFVNPYENATEAELYRVLSGKTYGYDDGSGYYAEDTNASSTGYDTRIYGSGEYKNDNSEDVYITFEEPSDTSTHD